MSTLMPNANIPLHVVELGEFLEMPIPERTHILRPIIAAQSINMCHAPRGVGKTFAAGSIALAVASGGSIYNWNAPSPSKVMYVDGEMPAIAMKERFSLLTKGMSISPQALKNIVLITPDLQARPMPDLSSQAGQLLLEPLLDGVDLIIIDNIATLCRSGKENEANSWGQMQVWLLDLRRRGMSVLLIHHSGKSGDQRGTSAREDIMDTVINLCRPLQYKMSEGARFEVHLTKARNLSGEEAEPFEAHLQDNGDSLMWVVNKIEDVRAKELQALLEAGCSIREAAEEMGIPRSTLGRLKKKLEAAR